MWLGMKKEGLTQAEMDLKNILTVLCVFVIFFLLFLILGYCYVNYLLSIYKIYVCKHSEDLSRFAYIVPDYYCSFYLLYASSFVWLTHGIIEMEMQSSSSLYCTHK